MRIFVTGASGWIGSAVVPELIGAGHQVVGLARSDSAAEALAAAGADVHRGTLDDLESLTAAAGGSDGVIHLAFKHEEAFSGNFAGAAAADRLAIEAFGEALAGSGRPLVIASGTLGLAPGRVASERDGLPGDEGVAPLLGAGTDRLANAHLTLSEADRGVRSVVLRLPPTTHGDGDNGFMAMIVAIAREKGVSAYIGDGSNRWPATHRFDAARAFRLAAESAPPGTVVHAIAEEGVPTRNIAEVIARKLEVPVAAVSPEDAGEHFTWLAGFFGADSPASSEATRELLGWRPTGPGLIEDLEQGHYFGG